LSPYIVLLILYHFFDEVINIFLPLKENMGCKWGAKGCKSFFGFAPSLYVLKFPFFGGFIYSGVQRVQRVQRKKIIFKNGV